MLNDILLSINYRISSLITDISRTEDNFDFH